MNSYFYVIKVQGAIREAGNIGADDLGVDGSESANDLAVVAGLIVARRQREAPSWEPFTGDEISIWGPVTGAGGQAPAGPAGHTQPIAAA